MYAANAVPASVALKCSPRYARVSVNAEAMQRPWQMRSAVNTVRLGADASGPVGNENRARLTRMPNRRSMRWLKNPTANPATAIPIVLALTAKPIAAGGTQHTAGEKRQM